MFRPSVAVAVLVALALGACASEGGTRSANRSSGVTCEPGETLICEVTKTGRITHGSFSKKNSRCACEVAKGGATVIPGVGQ